MKLFENVFKNCGRDFYFKFQSIQPISAKILFQGNLIARKLLCTKQKKEFCWLNMLNEKFNNRTNFTSVCSHCSQLLYSSLKSLESPEYKTFKPFLESYKKRSQKFLNFVTSKCPSSFFKDLPRVDIPLIVNSCVENLPNLLFQTLLWSFLLWIK